MNYKAIIEQISFTYTNTDSVFAFLNQQHLSLLNNIPIDGIIASYEILIEYIDTQIAEYLNNYGLPTPSIIDHQNIEYSTLQVIDNLKYARVWLRNIIWRELLSKVMGYFPSDL